MILGLEESNKILRGLAILKTDLKQ